MAALSGTRAPGAEGLDSDGVSGELVVVGSGSAVRKKMMMYL